MYTSDFFYTYRVLMWPFVYSISKIVSQDGSSDKKTTTKNDNQVTRRTGIRGTTDITFMIRRVLIGDTYFLFRLKVWVLKVVT